jgi:hypothetical protein
MGHEQVPEKSLPRMDNPSVHFYCVHTRMIGEGTDGIAIHHDVICAITIHDNCSGRTNTVFFGTLTNSAQKILDFLNFGSDMYDFIMSVDALHRKHVPLLAKGRSVIPYDILSTGPISGRFQISHCHLYFRLMASVSFASFFGPLPLQRSGR